TDDAILRGRSGCRARRDNNISSISSVAFAALVVFVIRTFADAGEMDAENSMRSRSRRFSWWRSTASGPPAPDHCPRRAEPAHEDCDAPL
ncbi:MAG: hypothetical protein L0I80_04815, partial [Brevibacterium sp.]|nr:hypothetical protein [Brevibacterium sp.]